MRSTSWVRKYALLLGICLGFPGCSQWRVETIPAAELVERDHPARVRLRFEGRREVLYRPEVRGDSLWGVENLRSRSAARAVALAGVTQVETSHFSVGRTAKLVLGAGAAVGLAFLIMIASIANDWGS